MCDCSKDIEQAVANCRIAFAANGKKWRDDAHSGRHTPNTTARKIRENQLMETFCMLLASEIKAVRENDNGH